MNSATIIKNKLHKGITILFVVSAIITTIGYIVEILSFSKYNNNVLPNNLVSITINSLAIFLYIINKNNLKTSYAIILYTLFSNIIIYAFINEFDELGIDFFLRGSLLILLLLTFANFALHKRHAIIISFLYILSAILITIISDNFFLKNSIILIVVCVGAYALLIRYFVSLLEKTIRELEEISIIIEKQTNELEYKNNELQKINKTKDKFLSILAHDLKNPIMTILGFAEVFEKKFDEISDDTKKNYLKNIRITSEKTYKLLNKILTWARNQIGVIKYNPEKVNIDLLLRTNLGLYSEIGKNKNITITDSLRKNSSGFADKNMLDTIIRNLLSNAIKFTHEGGKINASCFKKKNDIIVKISDNGIGMEKDELEKLFKIDQTISKPGTSDETGSGLGLLLCEDFVKKCNGQIWVSSEPGNGSVFTFSIPAIVEKPNSLYEE